MFLLTFKFKPQYFACSFHSTTILQSELFCFLHKCFLSMCKFIFVVVLCFHVDFFVAGVVFKFYFCFNATVFQRTFF